MIMGPLWLGFPVEKESETVETALKGVHDVLALELGREFLSDRWWFRKYTFQGNEQQQAHKNTYATICKNFLVQIPQDLSQGDQWIKDRLSLVELAFRKRGLEIHDANQNLPIAIQKAEAMPLISSPGRLVVPGHRGDAVKVHNARINATFKELVSDLNDRLRLALYPLNYHNGFIQMSGDAGTEKQVAAPFWTAVGGTEWENVDRQMKEAIDRRDQADRTAAFHAVCALESAIKIICGQKGWTTGKEKGASDYINHLNSKTHGRFIEPWEAEMLKMMFGEARNPFAHGPGQEPMPMMSAAQTDWVIDTAMSWTRNLIRRL